MFNQKQSGLTLIELMIAMVLGLFVSAVTITIFSTTVRSNVENMKMIRLNQELRGAMTMMVDEIKRSGYSADPTKTAFINDFKAPLPLALGCLRYSYDEDASSTRENDERFGFKLDGDTITWAKDFTSTDCSTSSTTPIPITDPNLAKITTLTFNTTGSVNTEDTASGAAFSPTATGVSIYEVTITLIGSTDLPGADDPSRTITETIRVRNDAPKS